jgi:transcriptional regulator with XRE-family HTH domain
MALIDTIKKRFARNLKTLRKIGGLTQEEFAEKLNENYKASGIELNRATIASYEREDGAIPKMDMVYCMAEYFRTTIDGLFAEDLSSNFLSRVERIEGAESEDTVLTKEELKLFFKEYYDFSVMCEVLRQYILAVEDYIQKSSFEDSVKMAIGSFMKQKLVMYSIERDDIFSSFLQENLKEEERIIFKGLMKEDKTVEELAKVYDLEKSQVVQKFNSAREKALKFFKK